MSEQLSALIIGCGDIAGGYDTAAANPDAVLSHAGAYRAHGGFDIAACVEPDADKRRTFMKAWGIKAGFSDLRACRASGMSFDVASLCSPSSTHEAILYDLAEMPVRAIFAEKPLTGSAEKSQPIVELYSAINRPLAVNYLRRWAPGIIALRSEIATGVWGEIRGATGRYAKGLYNCGSHLIDLLHYLIGPVFPHEVFSAITDYSSFDPTLSARLTFENKAPVVLIGSDCRDFFTFELTLIMAAGEIVIEDLGLSIRRRTIEPHALFISQMTPTAGATSSSGVALAMVNAVSNISDHITLETPLASDGQSALEVEKTCAAIMRLALGDERGAKQGDAE